MRETEFYLNRIIENELLSKNKIDMPNSYVEDWVKKNNDEETSKKIINEQFEDYCKQIKWSYIVDDIVEKHKISVENEEIEQVAKSQIEQQLMSSGMQNVGKDINKFVDNYLKHNKGENYLKIFNQVKSNKVFNTIKEKLGTLPIIAEDLGVITSDVERLRDKFEFPGMKILHFAFDSDSDNPYLPNNYNSTNWVVYTGTHDNNTTVGWFNKRSPEEQERVYRFITDSRGNGIHWDLIHLAMSSIAYMAIFPLQDILGLGEEAIMNQPGVPDGNWSWRYQSEMLTSDIRVRLKEVTALHGRTPKN